jgi:SAM-dependent methyltransferase
MARNVLEQIRSAWIRLGWRNFVRAAVKTVVALPAWFLRRAEHRPSEFDRQFGIETEAPVGVSAMGLDPRADSTKDANLYQPSGVSIFHRAISSLAIDYREYTFVDYGSGKGRALILAAQKPFAEVIGVEFSPSLHEAAQQNIARAEKTLLACSRVRSICCDAAEFDPPQGPLVCYFYNPFRTLMLRRVLHRLCLSLSHPPPPTIVLSVNPKHIDTITCTNRFELIEKSDDIAVFRAVLPIVSSERMN